MKRAEIVETLRELTSVIQTFGRFARGYPTDELIARTESLIGKLESTALPPNPDVRQMVRRELEDGGYDGLYCDRYDCGCTLDDLVPCYQEDCVNCNAGYYQHHNDPDANYCGDPCICIGSNKGDKTDENA